MFNCENLFTRFIQFMVIAGLTSTATLTVNIGISLTQKPLIVSPQVLTCITIIKYVTFTNVYSYVSSCNASNIKIISRYNVKIHRLLQKDEGLLLGISIYNDIAVRQ